MLHSKSYVVPSFQNIKLSQPCAPPFYRFYITNALRKQFVSIPVIYSSMAAQVIMFSLLLRFRSAQTFHTTYAKNRPQLNPKSWCLERGKSLLKHIYFCKKMRSPMRSWFACCRCMFQVCLRLGSQLSTCLFYCVGVFSVYHERKEDVYERKEDVTYH